MRQALRWIDESPAHWDADKTRVVGGAPRGAFAPDLGDRRQGEILPGDWWRVERDGKVVGYAWMDVTWGDAEILLAVDRAEQGHGVGSFILQQLEREAMSRGLRYLYNEVRAEHPQRDEVIAWLCARGFARKGEEGALLRAPVRVTA